MKKRFLSLLLVLVLIMSLMPAALAVNADDAQPKTISVTFRLHTDTDEWIAPTEVSDLPEGTSVFTVFQKVLADKGYTYEYHEQYCYVQAITAPDGTRLAEFSKGKNSGWLFRVNNDFADVGMNDFVLMDGDEIEVLYTADYKKEPGMSLPYTDVSWDHWAYTAIKRMYTRGLMVGVNETIFAPGQEMSRAMLAVILYANTWPWRPAWSSPDSSAESDRTPCPCRSGTGSSPAAPRRRGRRSPGDGCGRSSSAPGNSR